MKVHNSYYNLPKEFYKEQIPEIVKNPKLIFFNQQLETNLGLNFSETERKDFSKIFSGNKLLTNSKPISLCYAGHQFGFFAPRLGDGRAILLGEFLSKKNERFDIQLKGSGRTFYSRGGDGKYPLGPALREYIVSEAMHHLNVPTTRCLSLTLTNELVQRETLLPGAIVSRVAKSHIRIGSFEYFTAREDIANLRILCNYAIDRHYPECTQDSNPYLSFLNQVIAKQIELVSSWMTLGFIHGVMNTDNVTISGETIDYGPCAFMDEYDANKHFSYIDRDGRYNFSNQKDITLWNLTRFAESIIPLIDDDPKKAIDLATQALQKFNNSFEQHYYQKLAKKIGIFNFQQDDKTLIDSFLDLLEQNITDYTIGFRNLSLSIKNSTAQLLNSHTWNLEWQNRIQKQDLNLDQISKKMDKINPILIPRNHLIAQAIQEAEENNDFSITTNLLKATEDPFTRNSNFSDYYKPPTLHEKVRKTFCGT